MSTDEHGIVSTLPGRASVSARRVKAAFATALTAALAAIFLAGGASAEKPFVQGGFGPLWIWFGFSPKTVSSTVPTPAALELAAAVETVDGSKPPALNSLVFEIDRNVEFHTKGLPACHPSIEVWLEEACKPSRVGGGSMGVVIAFPEQPLITTKSRLDIYNAGVRDGAPTLYAIALLSVPTPAAIVSTVRLTKVRGGRYTTKAAVAIPPIAGGNGSVISFRMLLRRRFLQRGKPVNVVTIKCPDGKILARGEGSFADGTEAHAETIRSCG
jgi:hypothetical protein